MFDTAKSVTEIWVTKTDTYTSKSTGEIYANVQAISAIPEGARGNAKGFEITEYPVEPVLLDEIVFNGAPVRCKFASVVRPTQDRFGRVTNTQVLVELLEVDGKPLGQTNSRPAAAQPSSRQQPASDKSSEPVKS
ncbi:DNA-binding protein [Pseudomonas knackmussii]|uniref:DNA-binding protein n=1 Tax=Pseudomonas knackmussii TaxID=65741 RepID=UPI003F49E687